MKLLLDQGTPRSAAALLCRAGFDAVHIGDIGLATAGDEEILQRAAVEDRVVVTRSELHLSIGEALTVRQIGPAARVRG